MFSGEASFCKNRVDYLTKLEEEEQRKNFATSELNTIWNE
jgi:hypothetical protein